jgi:methyl-accepting chemotaxis protein
MAQLEEAIVKVVTGVGAIDHASIEISSAADDLSQRTERQAASIAETVASLREISNAVSNTADGARHADTIVSTTKSDAEKGGTVVRQAVEAIQRIEKSSQDIGQIIGVIDDIAFQTNLLALNAGVEAARAGESGKGFAVVASEVRALAQRSAEAAKEIKNLISTSNAEVGEGVELVVETGRNLDRIVDGVNEIAQVFSKISMAAIEQSTALQQINTAISEMDQDTQRNAAMVEETTAATHGLKREVNMLAGTVKEFQIGRNGPAAVRERPSAPRPDVRSARPATEGATARKMAPKSQPDDWAEF